MSENPRFVTVATYFHSTEAHIAAGRLEAEGIPVHLHGINHVSADWLVALALGGIRLQVPDQFAGPAKEALETEYQIDDPDPETCPDCGSSRFTSHSGAWKLSILAVHLLNIPLPWGKRYLQCKDCGHKWKST